MGSWQPSLHDDLAGHFRMDRAEVLVGAGIWKRERKLLVSIKSFRFELVIHAYDGMRHVVLVDPGNLRSCRYRHFHGREAEVIDVYFVHPHFLIRGLALAH